MKMFLFDASICNGCYGCQIACKDEHCEQDWGEYAAAQPITGQYWCKVNEQELGAVPFVHVDYTVEGCGHCDNCALLDIATDDAVYKREDGLVIIDPVKAKGQKALADACKHVFWNEELQLPQKCTGCAHLLDDEDSDWDVPRCVDFCPTGALQFGDEADFDLTDCTPAKPGSHWYYKNMPKRRICGTVADRSINEVIIGAKVTIATQDGAVVDTIETDELGDFIYKKADKGAFRVTIEAPGYLPLTYAADTTQDDAVIGEVLVTKAPTAPRPPKAN